jgi:tetratricopeptide (TPR) repeat protein
MKWLVTLLALALTGYAAVSEWNRVQSWRLRERADKSYYEGDFKKTLARYEIVIDRRDDDPRSFTDAGDTISQYLSGSGQALPLETFEELAQRGVRYYLKAINLSPPNAWSYSRLASIAESLGRRRSKERGLNLAALSGAVTALGPEERFAEAAWVKAIQIEPRNFYYRDLAGDFYWRRGFYDRASRHFRYSVRLHPILEKHYFLSDYSEASDGILRAVEAGVQDALEADDTDVSRYNIHRFLAELYTKLDRFDDAMRSLEAAAEVSPKPHAMDVQIGQLLLANGDSDGAIEHFRRATERKADYPQGWLHYALALSRREQHDAAVEAAYRARGLNPVDFATTMALARILHAAGMLDEAAEILEHALQTFPDRQQSYLHLIEIYEGQSKISQATRVARELAGRFPENEIFQEQLRQLQERRSGR